MNEFIRSYALSAYSFDGGKEDRFIAKLIHSYMRGKRVLDLGCGPVVAITSTFYPEAEEIVAVDALQDNLDFVQHHSDELEAHVHRAKAYKHRYLSKHDASPSIKLIQGDVRNRLDVGLFDAVMNIGCFGALDSPEEFCRAVAHTYHYLKEGGILLMINWVGDAKRPCSFNGRVHEPDVYVPAMKHAGFRIREIHTTHSVLSDETKSLGYEKIIWAVAEK